MNSCIRAVVRAGITHGARLIGIYNGFEGLINGEFKGLGPRDVGGILQRGGTVLQTRRSERFMEPRGQREAIRKINEAGMDGLVVIGGDGSMRGCHALTQQGIKVVGIPASIDNDIWGTNMAIGVDTAMNTIMDAVDKLRDTAFPRGAFLIETMGRGSGTRRHGRHRLRRGDGARPGSEREPSGSGGCHRRCLPARQDARHHHHGGRGQHPHRGSRQGDR
jgi:6-phosphofructokinase 1